MAKLQQCNGVTEYNLARNLLWPTRNYYYISKVIVSHMISTSTNHISLLSMCLFALVRFLRIVCSWVVFSLVNITSYKSSVIRDDFVRLMTQDECTSLVAHPRCGQWRYESGIKMLPDCPRQAQTQMKPLTFTSFYETRDYFSAVAKPSPYICRIVSDPTYIFDPIKSHPIFSIFLT